MKYAEVFAAAEVAALCLWSGSVRKGGRVAIYIHKSPALVSIMLALGLCVFLHARSSHPEQVAEGKGEASACATRARRPPLQSRAMGVRRRILVSTRRHRGGRAYAEYRTPTRKSYHDLFTSRITRFPKGVLMLSRQVAGYAITMAEAYNDVFGALLAGSTLCLAPQHAAMDGLTGVLNASRATHLNFTSSVAATTLKLDGVPHLKFLIQTGEPATLTLL
ncbi:hypothetical protein F4678DRAFT_467244 [Xylaria arbuscula]|nr:hypothetical protein F4678DRAFT_467244 [Xylaria arbuscula]